MEKRVFVASTEPRSGKSLVTLGLLRALEGFVPRVGYMKPIGQPDSSGTDPDARLVREVLRLGEATAVISPATMDEAQSDRDRLYQRVFDAYRTVARDKDIVVIEGTDYTSAVSALEFDVNAELAHNLASPVLVVANGAGKSVASIVESLEDVIAGLRAVKCEVLGVVVNRFTAGSDDEATRELAVTLREKKIRLFGAIPPEPVLAAPRLAEVARSLGAELVIGEDLDRVVRDVMVLAMTPENALGHIRDREGCLLITPGDRVDNILAVLEAQRSPLYPRFAGLLLTGGLKPGENVQRLLGGMGDARLPVLSVKEDTYAAAVRCSGIHGELAATDLDKLQIVDRLVATHLDFTGLYRELGEVVTRTVTPRMFIYRILEKAKGDRKHIVLPEGTEPRVARAAAEALARGLCDVTLLGDPEAIREVARNAGVDLGPSRLVDPRHAEPAVHERYAETLYELRKHKSVTREMAHDLMMDPIYYATMMVHVGDADGFVSGSTHSTADTLGPVLRVIRTREGVSLASSVFFMCLPDRVLVYGDCALVENPTAEQMADIAVTAADTAKAFGIEPVVALLSYSTGQSGKGKDVDKVREAARLAREKRPELPIEGPIQYDAAISQEVAKVKMKDSAVAGRATVYIFPDLDAGNTAYKAVQRSADIPAIGPVMQGLRKPANDLSRGATVTDILYTIAITAVQAQAV